MKIQDGIFIVVFVVLLFIRKPALLGAFGIFLLFLAIPLFADWIFFTAQRFVTYAAFCFFASIFLSLKRLS